MSTVEQIEAAIARLSRKLQLQVIERLYARLWPSGFAPEVEDSWSKTIKRRLDEMDSSKVEGVSAARVFAKSRRLLTRR